MKGLAVVTGASSGIGREFASQLAAKGLDVLVVARRKERLFELQTELEAAHCVRIFPLTVDLASPDAEDTIVAEIERLGRPLKWLVNNAGYSLAGLFDEVPLEAHNRALKVMLLSPVTLIHKLIPLLKHSAPAHLVNVASHGAFLPGCKTAGLYQGSKAFVRSLTEMLAAELNPYGINVTVSCPGLTETEILDTMPDSRAREKMKRMKGMSATIVAREAIAASERGDVIIVHGLGNKVLVYLVRVLPLRFSRWLMSKAYDA